MLVSRHIVIGAIASLLIFLIFPSIGWFAVLIIFLSSVLVDFDHYLYFAWKKKNLSLKKAYRWMFDKREALMHKSRKEQEKYKDDIIIFHGIEGLIILLLLLQVHPIFKWILIGFAIHMTTDFVEIFHYKLQMYMKVSQIYTHLKNKGKKDF